MLATILLTYIKEKKEHLEFILDALNLEKITKDVVQDMLNELKQGKKINLAKYKPISNTEIEKEIKKIVKGKKNLTVNAIMGILMAKYRGKVDGKKLIELINKYKK